MLQFLHCDQQMATRLQPLPCLLLTKCGRGSAAAVSTHTHIRINNVARVGLSGKILRERQRRARHRLFAASAATDGAAAAATEAAAAAAAALYGFCIEHELPHGRLVIRAAEEADVGAASVVLTRAFAGSAQGVPLSDGRKFCSDCLMQPPRGLLLVGRMFPSDTAQGAPRLRPGQMSRLIATAGLSFCSSTREAFPTLQPPDNAAYLANIAVDVTQRRLGYGRHMLAAAEALAAARGFRHLYLHVRLADQVARQLYDSAAYEVVGEDVVLLAKLRGITPRALMRKELTS